MIWPLSKKRIRRTSIPIPIHARANRERIGRGNIHRENKSNGVFRKKKPGEIKNTSNWIGKRLKNYLIFFSFATIQR